MSRGRGRPPGTGRWTEFSDAQVWARIEFRCWRDQHNDVSRAANALAASGWWQVRDGKIWTSNPYKDHTDSRIATARETARPGDKRTDNVPETLRARYYAARRRFAKPEKNAEFIASCHFWLDLFKKAHKNGTNTWDALFLEEK